MAQRSHEKPPRAVGENALQKAVRLLEKFNEDVLPEGVAGEVRLDLGGLGSGQLHLIRLPSGGPMTRVEILFGFGCPEQLVAFLEADQLTRLLLVRDWARE